MLLWGALILLFWWLAQVIFIDGVFQEPFANWFVSFAQNRLGTGEAGALRLYEVIFRNNKSFFLILALSLALFVIFYRAFMRVTKYFNEVSDGVDSLVTEQEAPIALSPEMEFMERKLNAVKNSLEKRRRDAKEAEQRKNDLVVYLAHDIKTPLTSVIGYLSLLDEAPDMPDGQKQKYVHQALLKAGRLEELINEFFDITRFNLQTILLQKEMINLPVMLCQMADEFYPMLASGGKTARVDAPEDLNLYGDADKLARVFNNILKNAISYSYDDSEILISARKTQSMVEICFQNRGKTIAPEKLSAVFEKFYRLDTARSTQTGGAGLGLAIAKEIVVAHGGEIFAQSENEITVFTVRLPSRETV